MKLNSTLEQQQSVEGPISVTMTTLRHNAAFSLFLQLWAFTGRYHKHRREEQANREVAPAWPHWLWDDFDFPQAHVTKYLD